MTLLRGLYLALLGAIPALLPEIVNNMISRVVLGATDPDSIPIASSLFISEMRFTYAIRESIDQIGLSVISFVIGLSSLVFIIIAVKKIQKFSNVNISEYYQRINDIGKWRILFFVIATLVIVGMVGLAVSYVNEWVGTIVMLIAYFALWHQQGVWGDLLPFSKNPDKRRKLFSLPKDFTAPRFIGALARVFVWWSIIALAWYVTISTIRVGVKNLLFLGGYQSPFSAVLAAALFGALILPLAYAVVDVNATWKQALARMVIPIIIFSGIVSVFLNTKTDLEKQGMFSNLIRDAGLETDKDVVQRIIVFASDNMHAYSYPLQAWADDEDEPVYSTIWDFLNGTAQHMSRSAPCSEDNINKLLHFSVGDNPRVLRFQAFSALHNCYRATWSLKNVLSVLYQNFSVTGDMLPALNLIGYRSTTAQENPLHIRYLQIIMGDPLSYVSAEGRERIQKVFDHYALASKTRGYVAGRMYVREEPAANIMVGLLRDARTKEQKQEGDYDYGVSIGGPPNKRLVASTKADAYGRFFFPALREGTYTLAAILPASFDASIDDVRVLSEKNVIPFQIDAENLSYSLGSVFLFKKDEMPADGVVTLSFAQDTDEDGLSDKEEAYYGTDPNGIDTDKDGFSDYNELNSGYDPLRPKVRYYPKQN